MTPQTRVGILSAVLTAAVGLGTIWYMRESHALQVQQLQLEKEKVEREKENAERERSEAVSAADTYRKQLEDAQTRYTNILGGLIDEASKEAARKEGPSRLLPAAQALVSSRNSFRSSLESINQRLNSEFDQLERELSAKPPDLAKIADLVEILQRKWPAKKAEIDVAIRKLIAELGLSPIQRK